MGRYWRTMLLWVFLILVFVVSFRLFQECGSSPR